MDRVIKQAARLLEQGKLVCFPTETVYGLAANARDEKALRAIYNLKGRDEKKPLAMLVRDIEFVNEFVKLDKVALKLAEKFCPGPISFVLPKRKGCNLPEILNSGLDTLSVRVPDHEVALAILREANCPVVATSANISGRGDSTTAAQVREYFGEQVDFIVEGECGSGRASTVVDLTGAEPRILREGEVGLQDILKAILSK